MEEVSLLHDIFIVSSCYYCY